MVLTTASSGWRMSQVISTKFGSAPRRLGSALMRIVVDLPPVS